MIRIFVAILVLLFLIWFSYPKNQRRLGFKVHVWDYRNPYSRRCIHCGRYENMYRYYNDRRYDRWETIYPLAHSPRKCRQSEE